MSKYYKAEDIEREIERLLLFEAEEDFDLGVRHGIETVKRVLTDLTPLEIVCCHECKYASDNQVYGCISNHFNNIGYHRMYAIDFCSRGERIEE